MQKIELSPIGIIHTPYKEAKNIPIQSIFRKKVIGQVEVFPGFIEGLKDIEGFSYLVLIWYFHKSDKTNLVGKPYLESVEHGIFAIRSPHRPNHLGISVVKLLKVEKNILTIQEIDILDGTPLLDIKPYVGVFDARENARFGWLEKHFKGIKKPSGVILK
jgi:tRNA-Thr(GGU) m(6)t(6)A37 methyltransferase TsaA